MTLPSSTDVWSSKLELSPPKRRTWDGDDDMAPCIVEVEARMKHDGMEQFLPGGGLDGTAQQRTLYYLYSRRFLYDDAPLSDNARRSDDRTNPTENTRRSDHRVENPANASRRGVIFKYLLRCVSRNHGQSHVIPGRQTEETNDEQCGLVALDRHARIRAFLEPNALKRINSILSQSVQSVGNKCAPSQAQVLQYGELDGAWTIFSEHFFPLQQRYQHGTNCYVHAPLSVFGYKVAFDKAAENDGDTFLAGYVDTPKFVRHNFSDDMLEKLVLEKGGNSKQILGMLYTRQLQHILPVVFGLHGHDPVSSSMLRHCGPGLIRRFMISQQFKDCGSIPHPMGILQFDFDEADNECSCRVLRFHEPPGRILDIIQKVEQANGSAENEYGDLDDEEHADMPAVNEAGGRSEEDTADHSSRFEDGTESTPISTWKFVHVDSFHALTLIGYRSAHHEGKPKYWYLIQNTWKNMPIFEASAAFLRRHMHSDGYAGVYFITSTVTDIPSSVDASGGLVHESTMLDGDDSIDDEPRQEEPEILEGWSTSEDEQSLAD